MEAVEDLLEPLWVHGYGSCTAPRMRQNAFYTSSGAIIYPAARHLIITKKNEEGMWTQNILSDHKSPISSVCADGTGKIVASGDHTLIGFDKGKSRACVNVWETVSGKVLGSVCLPTDAPGVRYVDLSADGKFLLLLISDSANTVCIYDTATFELVSTMALNPPRGLNQAAEEHKILDVKFASTNSIFATAGSNGVTFYVEEGVGVMGPTGLRVFEKRSGLHQQVGKDAEGAIGSILSRFENPDEIVSGTTDGHIAFWRGRNCVQVMNLHRSTVTSLHYSASASTLVSGGKDGKIHLLRVAPPPPAATSSAGVQRKGPKLLYTRELEVVATLDLLDHRDLLGFQVRSLCLSADAAKVRCNAHLLTCSHPRLELCPQL